MKENTVAVLKCSCIKLFMCFSLAATASTYYVDDDGVNDPAPSDPDISDLLEDGSVEHPFDSIQEGIDKAVDGDIVVVLPGTYYEQVFMDGKNIVLTSEAPGDPDCVAETIINGSDFDEGCMIRFEGSETTDCRLRGFTITEGSQGVHGRNTRAIITDCRIINNTLDGDGAGLRSCHGAIINCTIAGNVSDDDGAGLYLCNAAIVNCTIAGNVSNSGHGGGLFSCDGPITNCTIVGNSAGWMRHGGGLYGCDGPITNCRISDNTAGCGAGLSLCDGFIHQCVITDNTADHILSVARGGGLDRCTGIIQNCTIAGNRSIGVYAVGGGLSLCSGQIRNCIIWDNRADAGEDQLYETSIPSFSCIQDWTEGEGGNIVNDPLFVGPNDGDFHLMSQAGHWDADDKNWVNDAVTSPCIDAGDPYVSLGEERFPNGGFINMGGYGGSEQASKTYLGQPVCKTPYAGDINGDCRINLLDMSLMAMHWLENHQSE